MPQQGFQGQPQGVWQQPQMPPPMIPPEQAYPPPIMTPPPKKELWYRQTWAIVLFALLILGLCGGGVIMMMTHASKPNSNTTSTVLTQKSNTTPAKQTKVTATATNVVTATHGTPHIGGPMSDFIGKYGQPVSQGTGNTENFYADSARTILVNVTPQGPNQQIQGVNVQGQTSWSIDQAKAFCTQFLPSDAVAFNAKDNYANYHSSVGEIVLTTPGQGTCTLAILS
jgi:hypothetical protein